MITTKQEIDKLMSQIGYILIAKYPGCTYKLGSVQWYDKDDSMLEFDDEGQYPANFRKLEWWEFRKVKEMPKYLKSKNGKQVYKVMKHFGDPNKSSFISTESVLGRFYSNHEPATEEEYLAYKNLTIKL